MANRMNRRNFMKLGATAASALAINPNLVSNTLSKSAFSQSLASHVTFGNTSVQSNLNPMYFTYYQARQVYDTLIDTTVDGQLIPGLATAWQRVDPTTLEMELRDDVFFSNGDRFTANSVKATMDFLMTEGVANPGTFAIPLSDLFLFPSFLSLFDQDSFEVIDDTHLVIRTTRPDAIVEKRLSRLFVLSEQFIADGADLVNSSAGTGYFEVAEFIPGERIEFQKFEGNWRGDYPIQSATYVRVGDLRTALESGDIDIAQNIPADIARRMADSGNWNVTSKSDGGIEMLTMLPGNNDAFQDVRVRRAFNLAIDKQAFNDIALGGFGRVPTGQLLQPGMDGYNDSLEGFPFDPAEAMRLLDEAGYSGMEINMGAANTVRNDAEVIASYLEAIGVRVNLETPDSGTFVSELRGGTERDVVMWSAYYSTMGDWRQAMLALADPSPGAQKHIASDEFYALNQQILLAGDAETNTDLINQAATLMNEEALVVFLSWTDQYYIHSQNIQSIPMHMDNAPVIYAIEMLG